MDNKSVGSTTASHLVASGHRNIGVLIGPAQSELTQQRLKGVERATREAGANCVVLHAQYNVGAGEKAVEQLVESHPNLPGFVVGSNAMDLGAINWLERVGRRVPDDVLVVGVGSTRLSPWFSPRLTIVDVSLAEYARSALDYVVRAVRNEPQEEPLTLIRRSHALPRPRFGLTKSSRLRRPPTSSMICDAQATDYP